MKLFLFLILLFANLLFGYFQYAKSRADAGATAQLGLLEINSDKVKLVKDGARPHPAACLEWGSFTGDDVARAGAALAKLQLGDKFTQRDDDPGYWVYIPPLKSGADAEKKSAELKARGVADFVLIQDAGPWQFAISLGQFKTEEAADGYLAQLRQKNVRSAIAGPRGAKTSTFVIRDPGDAAAAQLAALKTDFPNAQLKALACAATPPSAATPAARND
ncbi:MAG TPA: SPOR domain-containing protein [Burkholderiales bacterium]|nr:SPOR domain-containing protein [Burkholderiales bacterium]